MDSFKAWNLQLPAGGVYEPTLPASAEDSDSREFSRSAVDLLF